MVQPVNEAEMREEEFETAIKVLVVGNGAVGKSSMIQRYCKGHFTREYKKTIGVDFLERIIEVNDESVRLMLWDTAGQEEFDAITKAYYRGAQACVIVFSTIDRHSFEATGTWKKKVQDECGDIPSVLVENKMDLEAMTVLESNEPAEMAKRLDLKLFRTSVKDNVNVDSVFTYLTDRYMEQIKCSDEGGQTHSIASNVSGHFTAKSSSRRERDKNNTIVLHPTKRRTNNKKKLFNKCNIL